MRLGTCIALELVVAAGAAGGVWLGVGRTIELAGSYLTTHEASAATTAPIATTSLPGAYLRPAPLPSVVTVFEAPDDVLLAPLDATPVAHVKLNHGGSSLSLRVEFASGARAAFKPQQIHPQSDPKREIAAYRIDRLLGIGHVQPAKPVRFAVDDLVAATDPSWHAYTAGRIADEAIAHDGYVLGELSWWIPEIRDAMIGGMHADEPDGVALWTSYLQVGATIPADARPMVEQLATCVVFDVLIDNADRWSGNNTKVSPDHQTLYFMDNTLSFSTFTFGHDANLSVLRRIQVFPRHLVDQLRGLSLEAITSALDVGEDPAGLGPLLAPAEIRAILARRDHLLQYIDGLIAQFGESAVLGLP